MANIFYSEVYRVVGCLPRGTVTSYSAIARALGRPRAAREVGRAMRFCPSEIPWQRVVMSDGSIAGGEYACQRKDMLVAEGVEFLLNGKVDMKKSLLPYKILELIAIGAIKEENCSGTQA